ncbi:Nucleoprotein TPR [Liparis tanakae]|uniref:Nucleoprotein TPR n=1 Tax=Liparis tanakae TaxID=230148 RepID=A0A4Z2E5P1_9TELE|nr:Nucleoprotein TPR [Liparis tanakae]
MVSVVLQTEDFPVLEEGDDGSASQSIMMYQEGADVTDPGTETEESLGASDSTQRPADSQTGCKIRERSSNSRRP